MIFIFSSCTGQVIKRRNVEGMAPPFLVFSIRQHVRDKRLPTDIKKLDATLMVEKTSYDLIGITFHGNSHYVAAIKSMKGWLFYDGLNGYLMPYEEKQTSEYLPSTAIYIKRKNQTN